MNRLKVVACLCIAAVTYSAVSLTVGPGGLIPYAQLEKESKRLEENLASLQDIRLDLEEKLNNLSADPDTIAIYAHELGYVKEGERLIKLAGFSGGIERSFIPGSALRADMPTPLPEWLCKLLGVLSGTGAALMMWIFSQGKDKSRRRRVS